MDHLQHYIVPQLEPLPVPVAYVKELFYDGLGFDQFPERVGFDVSELWLPTDRTDLQSWLYFAFAHEIFGVILDHTPHRLLPKAVCKVVNLDDGLAEIRIDSTQLIIAATAWMAVDELSSDEELTDRV